MRGATGKAFAAALAASVLGLPGLGWAAETIKIRLVSHATGAQTMDAGTGVEGQILGVAKFVGIGFTEDDRLVQLGYVVMFDYTKGAGPAEGKGVYRFEDGSVIRIDFTATAAVEGARTRFSDGKLTITGGSGKYADAKGDGTIEGLRVLPTADGGDGYFDVVFNVQ